MAVLVNDEMIDRELASLPGWYRTFDGIGRSVELPTFRDVISLVGRIADVAEQMDHHPDMDIRWRRLTIGCRTHAVGGVSDLDITLAHHIEDIVQAAG